MIEFTLNPDSLYGTDFPVKALMVANVFTINSIFDLIVSVSPVIITDMLIKEIKSTEKILAATTSKRQVVSKPQAVSRWVKFIALFATIMVCAVIWTALKAYFSLNCAKNIDIKGSCSLPLNPWMESPNSCSCLSYKIYCPINPALMNFYANETYQLIQNISKYAASTRSLSIYGCPLTELPPEISYFNSTIYLKFMKLNLTKVNIEFDNWRNIMGVQFSLKLSEIPLGLKNPPPSLIGIVFHDHVAIKELPEWVASSWKNLIVLVMEHTELTNFPPQVLALNKLLILQLSRSLIQSIPKNISESVNLQTLMLDGSLVTSVPNEIEQLKYLKVLVLSGTKIATISSLPWTMEVIETFESKCNFCLSTGSGIQVLLLNDSPVCKTIQHIPACAVHQCSFYCSIYSQHDNFCQENCNNPACEYDNGACLKALD